MADRFQPGDTVKFNCTMTTAYKGQRVREGEVATVVRRDRSLSSKEIYDLQGKKRIIKHVDQRYLDPA